MKMYLHNKQKGISLLEVMLSLAIIAIILVMATRYFGIASGTSKLNQAASQVTEIRGGLAQWQTNNNTYAGATLAQLANHNFITPQTATGTNPWGGNIKLNVTANTAQIILDTLPSGVCANLQSRFGTFSSCSSDGTTFTFNVAAQ